MYLITKKIGPVIARRFGEFHEDISTNGGRSNNNIEPLGVMDLNNNEWGINYALENRNSTDDEYLYDFNTAVLNKDIMILNEGTIPDIEAKRRVRELLKKYDKEIHSGL